jgi:hypothetical protein
MFVKIRREKIRRTLPGQHCRLMAPKASQIPSNLSPLVDIEKVKDE